VTTISALFADLIITPALVMLLAKRRSATTPVP
jgi:hypothetical protein